MDTEVTLITGPFRSGTSMLTGLLESCGFDLGRAFPVMRKPDKNNPWGHLEIEYVVMLNSYLLLRTVPDDTFSSWFPLPGIPDFDRFAEYCESRESRFRRFTEEFDGDLCKDPHFCLTLSAWKPFWKGLKAVIFCLRDPGSTADSISRRYGLSREDALEVWYRYALFFAEHHLDENARIFDLQAFYYDPVGRLEKLLDALGRRADSDAAERAVGGRWHGDHIHKAEKPDLKSLPPEIAELYISLKGKGNE